jgi:hypothetical protein
MTQTKSKKEELENKVLKFIDKWDDFPDDQTSRWVLCDSLEERKIIDKEGHFSIMPTDCACCFAGEKSEEFWRKDSNYVGCECPCHRRIEKLVQFISDNFVSKEEVKDKTGNKVEVGDYVKLKYSDKERWLITNRVIAVNEDGVQVILDHLNAEDIELLSKHNID